MIAAGGRVLVVGAGPAGTAAVSELRRAGFAGEVVVLCDDPDAPYDRPACSKGLLTGTHRPQDVTLPVEGNEVVWRLGRRAVQLDLPARTVLTDTGEQYSYDGLVQATGTYCPAPPGWPVGTAGIHQVHSLADAWALRADLRHARRVAVVGAGLTGCEVASAVCGLARDCVLIDPAAAVMARALGRPVADRVTRHIQREGVEVRLGQQVLRLHRWRDAWALDLSGGDAVVADVVVTTVGERPDTGWLAGSGLPLAGGVRCDEFLRVVGAREVVAAGAVARWPNPCHGTGPDRAGHWIAALEQGRAAARTLLAGDRPVAPVAVVPRFSSDQFGLRIQVCGYLPDDPVAVGVTELRPRRRDPVRAGLVVTYWAGGRLTGVVAVNAPHAFGRPARAVLAEAEAAVEAAGIAAAAAGIAAAAGAADPADARDGGYH